MTRTIRSVLVSCLLAATHSGAALSQSTSSGDVELSSGSFSYSGDPGHYTFGITAQHICNYSAPATPSGSLSLELWATTDPSDSAGTQGFRLADYSLTALGANDCYAAVASGELPQLSTPADGVYYTAILLNEVGRKDGGVVHDSFLQLSQTITVSHGAITLGGIPGDRAASSSCKPAATTLCIDDTPGDGRFEVQVQYATETNGGSGGNGMAIPLSSLGVSRGGLFWFFSADNPELLIKVINGCGTNNRRWVFASAGTNVGVEITVVDTATGAVRSYSNPIQQQMSPIQDTSAFPCS